MAEEIAEHLCFLLSMPDLYSPGKFREVDLRPETRRLLASAPSTFDRYRGNRMLLEDVFPAMLARCAPPNRDPTIWRQRMAAFALMNGAAYRDYVWIRLLMIRRHYRFDPLAVQDRQSEVLRGVYPERTPTHPAFVNAGDFDDLFEVVHAIRPFHTEELDGIVGGLLGELRARSAAMPAGGSTAVVDIGITDEYAPAAITYLTRTAYADDCRAFCRDVIDLMTRELSRMPPGATPGHRDVLEQALVAYKQELVQLG